MGKPPNTAILEFDKLRALANCFPILDNISSLTIISSTIIIYQAVHNLNIIFDFLCLFLTPIARLVWIVLSPILSAIVLVEAVMTRSEYYDKRAYPNSIAYTILFILTPPLPQM